ncbi:MAG: PAS domain-containing sensor histidine kinase [Pontiella sp.]
MNENLDDFKTVQDIQKGIKFTAELLQGDVTIRTFLESLAEGVVVINTDGRIVLINKCLEELFGYSKQEVQGERIDLFIPPPLRETHQHHISDYFKRPRVRPMGIGLDLTGQKKNGDQIPVEVSLSTLEVETGRIGLAFITDISARKTAEAELHKKNQQLDEFAQIVAHDLNSDVSTMVGLSEMLLDLDDDFTQEERRQYLQDIASGGRKVSAIIRELLLFARIDKGECETVPLDMTQIVTSVLSRLKRKIEESGATFSLDSLEVPAMGYSPWIEEVWFNYISNALKYGGSPPAIQIGAREEDGVALFWIKDNGPGLLPEDQALVFNDADDARKRIIKGHGLGLTIVKGIVEKLNGRIGVTSEPGEGSVFYFTLPLPDRV